MSKTLGVEIGTERVRAVLSGRGNDVRTFDLPIGAARIDDAVAQLRAAIGDVGKIGIAIGLGSLHVKSVKLPPASATERRRMLSVEPDRWFAVPSGVSTAVSLVGAGDIALGADGAMVDGCVAAFSAWGSVVRMEAAPVALARAMRASGISSGTAMLDAASGEFGSVVLRDGMLQSVRRARSDGSTEERATPTRTQDLDPQFSVALGAALEFDDSLDEMLLTPALERSFQAAIRRQVFAWGAAAALAVCASIWAAGVSRERLLTALESELVTARAGAATGSALSQQAVALDREVSAIKITTDSRMDALAAFAALGVRLPTEAVAQRVRIVGNEWQIEGNTGKAAAVLAALAAEPTFERVRFLAPSNRFRDGNAERETFAIAFAIR